MGLHAPAPARLTLASGSPRRSELLRAAGFEFDVQPSGLDEPPYEGGSPAAYADSLARAKAASVAGEVVVGADTVVVVEGRVLGKPADAGAAVEMLRLLSGRSHEVITAVAVRRSGDLRSGFASARVTFRELSPADIEGYVASGEPMDKAGAYAIQGGAGEFVVAVEGDVDTVIGLPVALLRRLLAA